MGAQIISDLREEAGRVDDGHGIAPDVPVGRGIRHIGNKGIGIALNRFPLANHLVQKIVMLKAITETLSDRQCSYLAPEPQADFVTIRELPAPQVTVAEVVEEARHRLLNRRPHIGLV